MKSIFIGCIVAIFSFNALQAQNIEQLKYEALHDKIANYKDKVLVVNFFATWCAPCVDEVPAFIEVNQKYKNTPNFKMLFVSLDKPSSTEKLQKFIKKNNIDVELVILDDLKRVDDWLPTFDPSWKSNIPATIIYDRGKKVIFYDKPMTKYELEDYINDYL